MPNIEMFYLQFTIYISNFLFNNLTQFDTIIWCSRTSIYSKQQGLTKFKLQILSDCQISNTVVVKPSINNSKDYQYKIIGSFFQNPLLEGFRNVIRNFVNFV